MKILISTTAIQLTFGLKQINLSPFNTIIIYPDAYYNKRINIIKEKLTANTLF